VGHCAALSWDNAGVATTKNNMAGKSMSALDNILYFFVITASPSASVYSPFSQMLGWLSCTAFAIP
jgi:hypothetical protein